jgi:transposase
LTGSQAILSHEEASNSWDKAGKNVEKYRVSLSDEERASLIDVTRKGKSAARRIAHARILLLADEGEGDDAIAGALGVGARTVSRVRKRLVTEGLPAALEHRPQPPRPDKVRIKGDLEQQLVRLACSDPPEGRRCWTLDLLAERIVALGQGAPASRETVRQALKKTTSIRGS